MKNYRVDQYFEFTFQTQTFATGAATDADALPTYRTYEENSDTVLDSGNCAKRDDANTTGYYYVRGQCTAALGYEVGKTYEVRVAATVASVVGAAVVGRFAILPALVWDSLYGGTDNLQVDAIQWLGTGVTAGAIPAAAAGASGGLPTTNGSKLNQTADLTAGQSVGVSGTVTVATNNDKTGYSLSVTPPTASDIATAVWAAGARTLTGFGTLVADIWASATRTLTAFAFSVTAGTVSDKTGYSLSVTPPTAAAVADAVWDESMAAHVTAGTTGASLNGAGSAGDPWTAPNRSLTDKAGFSLSVTPPTAGDIATAVWGVATRTLSSVGSLVADIWAAATRTLTAFGFTPSLDSAYDPAKAAAPVGAAMTLTTGERASIAAALLDLVDAIESGISPRAALRIILASAAGELEGAATDTVTISNPAGTKTRITATTDEDGNRSAITVDGSD
jgi:hypothetical protein